MEDVEGAVPDEKTTPDDARPGPDTATVGDRVTQAFRAQHRRDFLPRGVRRRAAEDVPLPIGHGQTNSQPSTVAAMLRLLDVPVGARVLDVGSGSGWTTALLAHLVGPGGSVLGLELVPDLAQRGAAALAASNQPWARIEAVPLGVIGRPEEGPYDRILVSAEATALPEELTAQLAPGGLLVIPVRGEMLRVRRTGPGPTDLETTRHGRYRFVPLR